jgi:hypothetical protein
MNQEQQLQHLFDMARQEPVETSVNDVHTWIGMATFVSVLAGLLSKFKIGFTKSIIMYTSIASVVGVGVTALVLSQSKTAHSDKKMTTPSTHVNVSEEEAITPAETQETKFIQFSPSTQSVQMDETPSLLQELFEEPMFPIVPVDVPNNSLLKSEVPDVRTVISISGDENTLAPFSKLSVEGVFKLVLIQGENYSYKTEGNYSADDLKISFEEKTKELRILYSHQERKTKKTGKKTVTYTTNENDLTLYLTFKSLEKLAIGGIMEVVSQTGISGENMDVSISGISSMKLPITASKLKLQASGATESNLALKLLSLDLTVSGTSSVDFTGTLYHLNATCSGASDAKFFDHLKLEKAQINLSGTSAAELSATITESVKIVLSGASELTLSGAADKADIQISGTSGVAAKKFSANDVKAQAEGASSLSMIIKEKAYLRASGTSSIKISGKPSNYDASATGAATIKQNEE